MKRKSIASVVCFALLGSACTHWNLPPAELPDSEPFPETSVREAHIEEEPPVMLPRTPLLRGALLLDASVEDSNGAHVGTLADALIDPRTGEVVCVVISLAVSEVPGEVRVLHTSSVDWQAQELEAPALALACSLADLSRHDELFTDLFDGSVAADVEGEITDIAPLPATSDALLLKVRDDENLLHRVLIEPAHLVERRLPSLDLGRTVQVEGVWTRDDTGKLLVVCALAQDDEKVVLRDAAGEIQWGELGQSLQSARELPARALLLADGSQVAIRGWILDCTRGVVPYFCVRIGGVERALPWSAVAYEEEARAWRVDLQAVGRLSNLRVITADGLVRDPL